MTSRTLFVVAAAGTILLTATAAQAQRIHRWVDAQGVVHYTDHPPPDSTRAEIIADIPKSNRPLPPPATAAVNETKAAPGSAKDPNAVARQRAADLRKAEETMKAKSDAQTVASCKARRDTFCNQGADVIRKQEADKAWRQYDVEMNGRMRSNAPRNGPPPRPPSMDRPSNTTPKKK